MPVMIVLPMLCAAMPSGLPGKRAQPGTPLYLSLLLAGVLISIPMVGRDPTLPTFVTQAHCWIGSVGLGQ